MGWLRAVVPHAQLAGQELCLPHADSLAEVYGSQCTTGQPQTVLIPCLIGQLRTVVLIPNWLTKNHVYSMLIGRLSAMVLYTQLAGREPCLPHADSLAEVHGSLCPTGQPQTVLIPCLIGRPRAVVPIPNWLAKNHVYSMLMGWLSVTVLYTQLAGQELWLPHADSLAGVHGSLCPTGWPRTVLIHVW